MSTFDGKVIEFPDIRIDQFRVSQKETTKPLAFFLSHVHSDHLAGLETCKSPFIYCSPATREILLRLEKYPHRMNFAKGILEARKQTYRHLKNLLKPIPLETPTTLELAPNRWVRVTLFDANHCTGAVAFLIEDDAHAILYTGDVRSEQWWVDHLVRHPLLLPYVVHSGSTPLKKLDCIYLDTTFACDQARYKHFPSKSEGVQELLTSVARYPSDTIFYFNTWTFGYEDVWIALSAFLRTRIHIDDYRFGLYSALSRATGPKPEDAHRLIGFYCGNHFQEGCLTRTQTRLHSCEAGTGCEVFEHDYVRITPIISRWRGEDMPELGAGGGHGDLDQQHELELDDQGTLQQLIMLCRTKLEQSPRLAEAIEMFLTAFLSSSASTIRIDANALQDDAEQSGDDISNFYDLPIENLVPAIVKFVKEKQDAKSKDTSTTKRADQELRPDGLPKRINFPYSRHSSTDELCMLIKAFQPDEIYPCTVDLSSWTASDSMINLFGHLYPHGKTFKHDEVMRQRTKKRRAMQNMLTEELARLHSPMPTTSAPVLGSPFQTPIPATHRPAMTESLPDHPADAVTIPATAAPQQPPAQVVPSSVLKIQQPLPDQVPSTPLVAVDVTAEIQASSPREEIKDSFRAEATPKEIKHAMRQEAYQAALGRGHLRWDELYLVSVSKHEAEEIL